MSQFPDMKFKKVCETASEREAEIKEALQAVSEVPNQILHRIERHPRAKDGTYPVTLVFRFVPPTTAKSAAVRRSGAAGIAWRRGIESQVCWTDEFLDQSPIGRRTS